MLGRANRCWKSTVLKGQGQGINEQKGRIAGRQGDLWEIFAALPVAGDHANWRDVGDIFVSGWGREKRSQRAKTEDRADMPHWLPYESRVRAILDEVLLFSPRRRRVRGRASVTTMYYKV